MQCNLIKFTEKGASVKAESIDFLIKNPIGISFCCGIENDLHIYFTDEEVKNDYINKVESAFYRILNEINESNLNGRNYKFAVWNIEDYME